MPALTALIVDLFDSVVHRAFNVGANVTLVVRFAPGTIGFDCHFGKFFF
jgi:hypothetical protein